MSAEKQRKYGGNYIGLSLTNKCNYTCRHCVFNSGPSGEGLTLEQIKKIVDHFPENLELLTISGGEPFTEKELLCSLLDYLKSKKFEYLRAVSIETNGFWARDVKSIKKTINELSSFGFKINLTVGTTKYHEECGQDIKKILKIKEVAEQMPEKRVKVEVSRLKKFFGTYFILPFGRARDQVKLPLFLLIVTRHFAKCHSETLGIRGHLDPSQYWLLIDFKGNVFGCCWRMHRSLGNAIEAPIIDLLNKVNGDPYFRALNGGGIRKAALILGFTEKEIKRKIRFKSDCEFCEEVHKQAAF